MFNAQISNIEIAGFIGSANLTEVELKDGIHSVLELAIGVSFGTDNLTSTTTWYTIALWDGAHSHITRNLELSELKGLHIQAVGRLQVKNYLTKQGLPACELKLVNPTLSVNSRKPLKKVAVTA